MFGNGDVMRKAILIMVLATISSSVTAEWVAVDKNTTLTVYANPATIFKNGNIVRMWGMRDFNVPQAEVEGDLYASIMIQKNFDCKKARYRISSYSYHAENMGQGRVVYNGLEPGGWREITSYSIVAVEKKIACGE